MAQTAADTRTGAVFEVGGDKFFLSVGTARYLNLANDETSRLSGQTEKLFQVVDFTFQKKSPETFLDKVELDSCPPALGDMEQPVTERENPPLPSGAPQQVSAWSAERNSCTESGDIGEPISLCSETAFEQLDQLTSEHGDQRREQACQQRGAEGHEMSGRSEETVEETELVVLDLEHPLMRRFQAALKSHLTKQMEKVSLELQELRAAAKKGQAEREELGLVLYGAQQQLARLQLELEKSHDRRSQVAAARQQLEEELEGLRLTYKQMCQNTHDERQKGDRGSPCQVSWLYQRNGLDSCWLCCRPVVSAMQTQVENLALHLFYVQNTAHMHHNILLTKRSTKRAELEKDLLVDRLTRKAYELQEQIALFEAQFVAQAEDTKVTRQAANEACMEVQAINMEKKRLMNHWNSSLAGMKQRDETEQALNRTRMDQAACLNQLLSISKDIEKGTDAKVQMENEIMAKLQDQMIEKLEDSAHTNKRTLALSPISTCGARLDVARESWLLAARGQQKSPGCIRAALNRHPPFWLLRWWFGLIPNLALIQGQELGPLEMEINKLSKQIEEYHSEVMTLQKHWLNQQQELVKLTHQREEQVASLDTLKKRITVMQQKKVRRENEIQQETKEQKDIERHMRNMSNDLIKLNVLIHKNSSSFEELQYGNTITENEFVRSLKAAEKESVEMQEKHSQLTEEKERLLNSLVEAEHQILLWEKKIQLTREMRAAVESESGHGELHAMRTEIHRMQVRYGQLMKQQEKMIRDMEASVSRREVIALRGEGQNKRDKKLVPKSVFHCKKQELRKKISKAQKNVQDCNATLLELESAQASLGAAFLEKQRELRRLEPE
ncbi:coiled-coil domain-containing protein 40-like, partial [Leptosomus discolor]